MSSLATTLAFAFHVLAAAASFGVLTWLALRRRRPNPMMAPYAVALALSGTWSIVALVFGPVSTPAVIGLGPCYLAWLWVLYRLFERDGRLQNLRPTRPVFLVLIVVECVQMGIALLAPQFFTRPGDVVVTVQIALTMQLMFVIGALVLVHNLYVGASAQARESLRAPAAALAVLWTYDLHLFTLAYLSSTVPLDLVALRGVPGMLVALLVGLGLVSGASSRAVRPSRAVTFQTFSLLLIGVYLLAMIAAAQGLALIGGDFTGLMQAGFVLVMIAIAGISVTSARIRAWLRVTLSKHLFQHRYDYRAEWLRFNRTIGREGGDDASLHERAVQVIADITESPAGVLLVPSDDGALKLAARWRWQSLEVPGEAAPEALARQIETEQYILSLDDVRKGLDKRFDAAALPEWLTANERAWLLVPLNHFDRLVGVVIVARPSYAREVDWEDFDLLRIVGQQLASYLAEHSGQEALSESSRFDEFNRRIAFVMHDIKNLASQMSLLARNSERHADKPEFRADMLVTLRNSADKLNGLLARLDRYGSSAAVETQPVELRPLLENVVAGRASIHPISIAQMQACTVMADAESLEQAVVHLVQNAVDASTGGTPVFVNVQRDALQARIEIIDSGVGMSPDFVRSRLFKPFHSTKDGGFGIGAFEARETIRSMGGRLDVESREGLGTRFTIRLPLAATESLRTGDNSEPQIQPSKVA